MSIDVLVGSYRGIYMYDILMMALFIAFTIYVILKNRKILKELSKIQILGVGISYIVTVITAFICIYFGGNWIAGYSPSIIVKYIVQLIVVCITLYLCVSILNNTLEKITKGVLPKK